MNIEPDTKDWTWVLDAACPECGLLVADVAPGEIAARVGESLPRWSVVLDRPDARVRPDPTTWSPTEYACHVRDVHVLFAERMQLMLDRDAPQFADWNQDETAMANRYSVQEPTTVSTQLAEAAGRMIAVLESVPDDAWDRAGQRSNGSRFTVATLAQYYFHDVAHHLHDVEG